jgi:hypothetical protein
LERLHLNFAPALDLEMFVRLLKRQPSNVVAIEIRSVPPGCRRWIHKNLVGETNLPIRVSRLQMHHVVAQRYQLVVDVLGDVTDTVTHELSGQWAEISLPLSIL